nr:MAG TPA: hypothetical protein [Caudoviricetes sp.]
MPERLRKSSAVLRLKSRRALLKLRFFEVGFCWTFHRSPFTHL